MIQPEKTFRCQKIKAADDVRLPDSSDRYDPAKAVVVPRTSLDQWLLGPEAAVAMVKPWGVLGVLVSHQWDVAGEDDFDTSITGGQYFYAFNLKDGWQINASPTFSYNHKASSGNETTFPLGIGTSKTTFLGGRPYKFGLQFWHYVESPDNFGPDYQVRFTVSPVVKLPW